MARGALLEERGRLVIGRNGKWIWLVAAASVGAFGCASVRPPVNDYAARASETAGKAAKKKGEDLELVAKSPKPAAVPMVCAPAFEGCKVIDRMKEQRRAYEDYLRVVREELLAIEQLVASPGIPSPKADVRVTVVPNPDPSKVEGPHQVDVAAAFTTPGLDGYERRAELTEHLDRLESLARQKVAGAARESRVCLVRGRGKTELVLPAEALEGISWYVPATLAIAMVLEGESRAVIRESAGHVSTNISVERSGSCDLKITLPKSEQTQTSARFTLSDVELCAVRRAHVRFLDLPSDRQQRYALVPKESK